MYSRWMPTLLFVACSLCANWTLAQSNQDRPRSLAARLAELRREWADDSELADEPNQAAGERYSPSPGSSSQSSSAAIAPEDERGFLEIATDSVRNGLPRVNPRNLLTLDPFEANSSERTQPSPATASAAAASYADGSTIGRSRTRPGSRPVRSTSGSDVAEDLGVNPRVAARPNPSNNNAAGNPSRYEKAPPPAMPIGIVPMPGRERVGSVLSSPPEASPQQNTVAVDEQQLKDNAAAQAELARKRQIAATALRNELVGSGVSSRDTSGFGGFVESGSARGPELVKPVDSAGEFTSAADAARNASMPNAVAGAAPTKQEVVESAVPSARSLGPATIGINRELANQLAQMPAIELPAVETIEPIQLSEAPLVDSQLVMSGDSAHARRVFATQSPSPSDAEVPVASPSREPQPTRAEPAMLAANDFPSLSTRVIGPRQIMVGREATFAIRLENHGGAAADQVVTAISIPEWAKVVRDNPSGGNVQQVAGGIEWQIDRLAGQNHQTLELVLIPSAARPIELGVAARHTPIGSTTLVEVQEPKLEMVVSGPDEVFFGRSQNYRLTLSNPGTGVATNLRVAVILPDSDTPSSSHVIERLAPGETKSVDFEMTARKAGQIAVRAIAQADGGLQAETEQGVLCRKAELELDWRGPERKYAGTPATYYFRIRNTGTATAERTSLAIALPAGFAVQNSSDGAQHDAPGRRITWPIGAVEAEGERFLELTGIVNDAGRNEFSLVATTESGETVDRKSATTEVVAVADLKLQIADPKGPIPVGREVAYEITITNRGRSAAENVQVVALFSEGIEPTSVEGATASIANGRVGFPALPVLQPGAQTQFRIKAKSLSAGTHLFRAEVLCSELDIKLAAEESTQFYVDENPTLDDSTTSEVSLGSGYTPTW